MSDLFRKIIEDQERIRKLTNPFGDLDRIINPAGSTLASLTTTNAMQSLIPKSTISDKLLADVYRTDAFTRLGNNLAKHKFALEGPLSEARRIGLLDSRSDISKAIAAATQVQSRFDKMFRLPQLAEITGLAEQALQASSIAKILSEDLSRTDALRSAMANMTQPWLRIEHASQSAAGLAKLVTLGTGIHQLPSFERRFTAILRPSLGDWRDLVSIDIDAMVNPANRTELYAEQGVDPDLTDFTVEAFHEGAVLAGLELAPERTKTDTESNVNEEEYTFARAEKAYTQLRRFEVAVRKFIAEAMEDAFGEHWMKRQLPKDMRDKWADKRQSEIDAGRVGRPLIEYADFSDYRMIIERGDNWRSAFKSVFRRQEDVRESLQRLNPVRIATMHSRIVTLEDELLLIVETSRVLKAISQRSR